MNVSEEERKELRKLININEDACEFYETAQEKAESTEIVSTFRELENLHKGVLTNLQSVLAQSGKYESAKETLPGQASQFWGTLMAKISNDVDETLVTHLEEAEDRCLHSMEHALESKNICPETKTLLRQELSTLHKSHDYMKTLKECMKAA